jgi:predicted hydrolase (HD superfamily)
MITRETAQNILSDLTKNPSLLRHMRSIELVMRAYARKYNEDEDQWGIAG